jgi:hypothetical protein
VTAEDLIVRMLQRPGESDAVARRVTRVVLIMHADELADMIENSGELRDHTDDHMGDVSAAASVIRRHARKTETEGT